MALSLGELDDIAIFEPLARIALAGADDDWTRLAVASAVPRQAGLLVAELCRHEAIRTQAPTAGRLTLAELLRRITGHIPHHVRFIEEKKRRL